LTIACAGGGVLGIPEGFLVHFNRGVHFKPLNGEANMKMKLQLIASAALAIIIMEIGKARNAYDVSVQSAALQVLGQSWVHRNITPAMELVKAVSKHDRATLVAYLEKFGQMRYDAKTEELKFLDRTKEFADEKAFEAFEEAMVASKWYDARKPLAVKSVYDAQAEIGNLIDRLLKKAGKGAEIKNKVVLLDVHAAYCASVAKHYGESQPIAPGQQPQVANAAGVVQADRVGDAAARVAEQAAQLAEHFGKPVAKAA
jgi:hypothetical protein